MKILLTISFFCLHTLLLSQVGINTTSPNASLDIRTVDVSNPSITDGLLIPKMNEFPSADPTIAQDGMIVFATGAGSISKGYYYWNFNTTSWIPFVTGTVSQDEDWFEVGTTTSPNNITDHIYREGNISIGENLDDFKLHVYADDSAEQLANFDFTTNITTASQGIKNTLTINGNHTGNSSGISNTVNALANGPSVNLNNVLNASGTGSKTTIINEIPDNNVSGIRTGILNDIEATGNLIYGLNNKLRGTTQIYGVTNNIRGIGSNAGNQTGVYNDLGSGSSGTLIATENRFTGAGAGNRIGVQNFYNSSSTGTKYGARNYFYPSNNGIQYGVFSEFASNTSSIQKGVVNEFNGSGTAEKTGIQNKFETDANGPQIGVKNEMNSTSNTSQSAVKNVFDNSGATERHGLYNEFINGGAQNHGVLNEFSGSGNSSKNYYGLSTVFDLDSHGSTVGMRNQFRIGSNSGGAIGNLNLFTGAGNSSNSFNVYGQVNSLTDTDSRKTGIQNSFSGSGSPFITGISQTFSANTTSAFITGITQSFASNNNAGRDQFGLENYFTGDGTSPKVGVKNYYDFNDGNSVGFENDFRNSTTATKKGLFNRFRSSTSSSKIGVDNDFEASAVGLQTGVSNNFLSTSGQGIGVVNTSNRSSGSDAIYGVYNYFQGANTGTKYGIYNLFPASSGGTHFGIYSSVLKSSGYAGYFLGRVSIGTSNSNKYIFPSTRGNSGQLMQSDATGNLTWVDAPQSQWQRSGTNLSLSNTGDDLVFTSAQTSISFPATSGTSPSMFYMFNSGTANADRMIFSQSASFANYGLMYRDSNDSFRFLSNGNDRVVINIGGGNPLVVNGTAQATSFQSATTTYPDYVFEAYLNNTSEMNPDYHFLKLPEVEQFISANGHLPGVVPFSEVKEKGMQINLTETSIKNLEKIEELFLHAIELKKENEELKRKQARLEKRLERLEQKLN